MRIWFWIMILCLNGIWFFCRSINVGKEIVEWNICNKGFRWVWWKRDNIYIILSIFFRWAYILGMLIDHFNPSIIRSSVSSFEFVFFFQYIVSSQRHYFLFFLDFLKQQQILSTEEPIYKTDFIFRIIKMKNGKKL